MEIKLYNQLGKSTSDIDLNSSVFEQPFNSDLVHQLISIYIANSHQGTKGQKNRSAVQGGGKKPWRQKGTGRARAGTSRSPIWRGGGITFAHVYTKTRPKSINKKMYRLAMRSIWSKVLKEERLVALSELVIEVPPKSSEVNNILKNLGLESALFVLSEKNEELLKASKNLKDIDVQTVHGINPSMLLRAKSVVVTSSSLESISASLN
ncbi:MAG: 50S ribosomal protein L4 [SAR86 cluster bacterium]|nr:50S ribosomal protein L4 [SAR86 cluster bacterium]